MTKYDDSAYELLKIMDETNENLIDEYIQKGGDIDYQFDDGLTFLHWAIYTERFNWVEKLIEVGANINCLDSRNISPLHRSIRNCDSDELLYSMISFNNIEIFKFLLEQGADATHRCGVFNRNIRELAEYYGNKQIIEIMENHIICLNIDSKPAGNRK